MSVYRCTRCGRLATDVGVLTCIRCRRRRRLFDRMGCIACSLLGHGYTGAQVHHIREGRQARSHWLTIPLCREHHQGTTASVHMAKPALMRQLHVSSEFDLLAEVLSRLER